ncbi:hypothetical protein ASG14_07605 [Pedobacter sp. Leaf194]|nr:hypothetical protein ASG14_07605 [Pedobacter sp. Leaf194]
MKVCGALIKPHWLQGSIRLQRPMTQPFFWFWFSPCLQSNFPQQLAFIVKDIELATPQMEEKNIKYTTRK